MIFHFVSIGFIGSHNKIHPAHAMLHCHCDRGCGNAWKSGEWPDLCSITWCRKQPARTVSCLTKWKVLHKCLWGREATRSWQWAEPAHFLEATFFAAKSAHSIVEGNTVGCWSLQKGRCCAHECVLRLEVLRGWKATGSWSWPVPERGGHLREQELEVEFGSFLWWLIILYRVHWSNTLCISLYRIVVEISHCLNWLFMNIYDIF